MMTCQEFESLGPDFERHPVSRAAAEEHLRSCPRCSALLGSWKDLDGELRALARETSSAAAPLRVELALREAVRGLRPQPRAGSLVPVWLLGPAATAAVAFFAAWYVLRAPHAPQKLANPSSSLAAQPPAPQSHRGDSMTTVLLHPVGLDVPVVHGDEPAGRELGLHFAELAVQ